MFVYMYMLCVCVFKLYIGANAFNTKKMECNSMHKKVVLHCYKLSSNTREQFLCAYCCIPFFLLKAFYPIRIKTLLLFSGIKDAETCLL